MAVAILALLAGSSLLSLALTAIIRKLAPKIGHAPRDHHRPGPWADLRALTILDNPGLGKWPSIILPILWIAGITNAFNFLDNMDGLSAGVAAVCGGAFLLTVLTMPEPRQLFVARMLALFIRALLGFPLFNLS